MVFSSLEFLFWFLPIFLIVYFIVRPPYRNIVLFVASLLFYAYGEPIYIFLMLGSIIVNYAIGRAICRIGNGPSAKKRALLIIALVIDFGLLFVFKYINFFIGIINGIAGVELFATVAFTLPLGISFYTFQIASYMIDVYRGNDYLYQKDKFLYFATYVCMFPQLIAGPIVNYSEVAQDMRNRKTRSIDFEAGLIIFIIGMAFKVLLANKIGSLWNDVQTIGPYGINTATAWLGSWGYSMQLYFDFFGYSLMAIGLGRIMGFRFPDNFINPYCSKSATEFWRRWHITLGRWFREYVYIPLGGSRKGVARTMFNLLVVWFLTGFWHGANWNFIIWGLFFFVIIIIEKNLTLRFLNKSKIISRIYMLLIIPVSWTIFNITDLKLLWAYIRRMFGALESTFNPAVTSAKFAELFGTYWWLLAICAVCCTPIPLMLYKKFKKNIIFKLVLFGIFWFCVYQLAQGATNPFLYFRF